MYDIMRQCTEYGGEIYGLLGATKCWGMEVYGVMGRGCMVELGKFMVYLDGNVLCG